jgi:alkylation response protein AidB-like acyl-CoA dehydrogenase
MLDELDLTDSELAFQREVRKFYAENLTDDLRKAGRLTTRVISEFEYGRQWQRILHAKGWGAPHWPVEFGGQDWTPMQRLIWESEMARARPPGIMTMGRDYCAPCIMAFGTEQQKNYFLPRILAGDDWWAQGYSEPNAGSDLASLQMKATVDGSDYVLNGSKIWTTFAQHANRIFCLVRTATMPAKQQGITFLLVDLDTPGIEIRPIITIAGEHEFNQIFFTDVRVPITRRLGAENEGWDVARHLLQFEHGAALYGGFEVARRLAWLKELASVESDGEGGRLLDDPDFSRNFAEVAADCQAAQTITRQLALAAKKGAPPSPWAELYNIRQREVGQRLTELLIEALGYYGMPFQKSALAVKAESSVIGPAHAILPTAFYFAQRAATIAGGTAEIHRNNVAKRLLGL